MAAGPKRRRPNLKKKKIKKSGPLTEKMEIQSPAPQMQRLFLHLCPPVDAQLISGCCCSDSLSLCTPLYKDSGAGERCWVHIPGHSGLIQLPSCTPSLCLTPVLEEPVIWEKGDFALYNRGSHRTQTKGWASVQDQNSLSLSNKDSGNTE